MCKPTGKTLKKKGQKVLKHWEQPLPCLTSICVNQLICHSRSFCHKKSSLCLFAFIMSIKTYMKIFLLLAYIQLSYCYQSDNVDYFPRNRYRNSRTCKHRPYSALEPFYRKSILESTIYLVFIILLGILFGLMFLGK